MVQEDYNNLLYLIDAKQCVKYRLLPMIVITIK